MSDRRTTTECMCWKCGRIATLEAQNTALVEALKSIGRIADMRVVGPYPTGAVSAVFLQDSHIEVRGIAHDALTPDATQAAAAFVARVTAQARAEEREATTEDARVVAKKVTAQYVAKEREACVKTLAAMHRCKEHDLESCPGANAEYLRAYVAAIRSRSKDGGT